MGADKRLIGQSVKLSWLPKFNCTSLCTENPDDSLCSTAGLDWMHWNVGFSGLKQLSGIILEADRFSSGDASVNEKVRLGGDWKGNGDWRSWAWSELPKITSDANVWENLLILVLFFGFWSISSKLWNGKPSIPRTYLTHCKIIVA